MSELTLVTFGDSRTYAGSLQRLKKEAEQMGLFKCIWTWNETDLDETFRREHGSLMVNERRGFGYWVWKPQVVLQALRRMKAGDVLLYLDAGCELNPAGKKRLQEYARLAQQSPNGVLGFHMGDSILERNYTKAETVADVFPEANINLPHILSGIHLWICCPAAVSFAEEWLACCVRNGYRNITDVPSSIPNAKDFVEHRHDQSVFSLLARKHGMLLLPDETFCADWKQRRLPIHASRLRF